MSQNAPTTNQQNMIQMIQPAQATRLLEALKEELAQAKATSDPAKARQHYSRAEQIKQVLVNYRQQQQQQAAARANAQGGTQSAGAVPQAASPMGQPSASAATAPAQQFQNTQAALRAGAPRQTSPMAGAAAGDAQGRAGASGAPGVTTENYNEVRTRLQDLERKIRALEAGKRPDMPESEATQIDNQLQELRLKFGQYSKFALYMKNKLIERARAAGNTTGMVSSSPAPARTGSPAAQAGTPSAPPAAHINATAGSPLAGIPTPAVTNALVAATNANAAQEGSAAPAAAAGGSTPARGSNAASPAAKDSAAVPGVNLSLITKPSVPPMPILSTINVKPPNPITLKTGANNIRPSLTGGGASGIGQIVGSPAIVRMPTFDMASTGPIADNGGRVLTKRKLTELVNTIGADEGDGKTTIDGDVEELLLDLADEFVNSVTTFACRLAKHRKTDSVDLRDVQLHLERNWNIRIPGHAMDEIRGMRKLQPSSSYTQKVSGVEIAKAVNGNIN